MAITINNVRFSYCNLFQPQARPGQEPKYSVTILVPKSNAEAKAIIDQAIAQAVELGVSKCWNGVRPPQPAICVHDGDEARPNDGQPFGEECRGCWVFTASSKNKPFVVDTQVQNIIDPAQVYSGMWGNVNVNFFPYNSNGKKGIGCGLNGVQKTQDGELLGGHVTAQEAFQPVPGSAPAAVPAPAVYTQPYAAPAVYTQPYAAPAVYTQPYAAPAVNPITGQPLSQGYTPTGMPIAGI